jgi:NAD(P)-dependent dehydrogenase (short-subunit alcohol dehydrogenase family)
MQPQNKVTQKQKDGQTVGLRNSQKLAAGGRIAGSGRFPGSIASAGNVGQISYSSTKAGLEGAASTLMAESMYYGVRCSVIHPGFTDTPMVRALGEEYIRTKVLPQTQLKRLIKPEEIADAICFMVTNAAVSGELWADAGWRPAT